MGQKQSKCISHKLSVRSHWLPSQPLEDARPASRMGAAAKRAVQAHTQARAQERAQASAELAVQAQQESPPANGGSDPIPSASREAL